MKRLFLFCAIICAFSVVFPAGAMAETSFMVNAATSGSDAFFKVAVTPDGGYAGFGEADDIPVVSKFNPYGYLEWSKSFPGVVNSNCNSGAAGDDALFLTGRTESNNLWVVKIAPWGKILWQKTYTHTAYSSANMMGTSTVATADGGCAIGIRINVDGFSGASSYDQGLVKINADGALEWIKCYGTANYDLNGEIIESRDTAGSVDGYIIATAEDDWAGVDDNGVVLVKVDTAGSLVWAKFYEGYDSSDPAVPDGNEFVKGLCQTADYGYAVVGTSYSGSDPAWEDQQRIPFIIKVEHDGTLSWSKRFGILSTDPGGAGFNYGDVAQASDNTDLILAGTYWGDDFWLLRMDSAGAILTERVYPAESSGTDYLSSVAAADDGGGVASRTSKSFGAGDYDAFLMKFDSDLGFQCTDCDRGYNPGSEIADMTFKTTDIIENTHELDYTASWTAAENTIAEADTGFLLWYCVEDIDDDDDGVENFLDNCPLTANPGQEDGDGDGYGNACDADLSNDGVVDMNDYMKFRNFWGSEESSADLNSDGNVSMPDFMMFRNMWGSAYPWY